MARSEEEALAQARCAYVLLWKSLESIFVPNLLLSIIQSEIQRCVDPRGARRGRPGHVVQVEDVEIVHYMPDVCIFRYIIALCERRLQAL